MAAAVLLVAACTDRAPQDASPRESTPVGTGRVEPVLVATATGPLTGLAATTDGSELLVAEQGGRVVRLRTDAAADPPTTTADPTPVLDLSAELDAGSESTGLLGIALVHDDRRLVVFVATGAPSVEVRSYPYRTGATIDTDAGGTVLAVDHPFVHKGGALEPLPDGDLLVSVAALGLGGEPGAQEPDGVVLRVPSTALAGGSTDRPAFTPTPDAVVARGLRNPWRIHHDAATGDLWIADVGEGRREEITRIRLPEGTGANLGWPYREGSLPFLGDPPPGTSLVDPTFEYDHGPDRCAVIGGVVPRTPDLAALGGGFLHGDFCSRSVRVLDAGTSPATDGEVAVLPEPPSAFGEGADRTVYVLGGGGGIYRLVAAGSPASAAAGRAGGMPAADPPVERPGSADCHIARAVADLDDLTTMEPGEIAGALDEVLAVLETTEPERFVRQHRVLVAAYRDAIRDGRQSGWDASRDPFRGLLHSVSAERGPNPSALWADLSLRDAAQGC